MDPVSIGLLLAGLAASAGGNALNANTKEKDYENTLKAQSAQTQQQTDEAAARNAVLQGYQGRTKDYIAQDQGVLSGAIDKFAPPAQTVRQADLTANRQGAIGSAIDGTHIAPPQLKETDSPAVAAAFEKVMHNKMDLARTQGQAQGALGAVDDNVQRNNLGIADAGRDIGTTNFISRSDNATLPAAQDLAGFGTRQIINQPAPGNQSVGDLLTGLGTLAATVGGSGALKGAVRPANVSSLWNPINGVTGQ